MSKARLYDIPEVTREVLKLVIKGNNTRNDLAEELGCSPRTVYNKVHDPKILGFLKREDGKYVISDKSELMKLFQLDKREILKERFENLPGVEEINDELVGGSLTFERVGRIISYYTNSEAIDEDAFETYGRIYSKWFDFLGMGYAYNRTLSREKPANYEQGKTTRRTGDGYPVVRPKKAFEALHLLGDKVSDEDEFSDFLNVSDTQISKILSTLYSLDFARRNNGIQLTERGRDFLDSDNDKRQKIVRDALLEIELVKTYVQIAPNHQFKNQELMKEVAQELNRDWTKNTRETKAKRIYRWLLYSGLFTEVKNGTLVPSSAEPLNEGRSIEDYV